MDPDPASLLHTIDFDFIFGIIATIILLACSAFISVSEVALFYLSQKYIDEVQNKDFNKGLLISRLLEKPKKLLATILVANNFVSDLNTFGSVSAAITTNAYGIVVTAGAGYNIYHNSSWNLVNVNPDFDSIGWN